MSKGIKILSILLTAVLVLSACSSGGSGGKVQKMGKH